MEVDEFEGMAAQMQFLELVTTGVPVNLAGIEVGWTLRQVRHKLQDEDFAALVADAQEVRDDGVEYSLYQLAQKGNLAAIQMILFNRRSNEWRDIKRIEVKTETTINVGDIRAIKQAAQELMREGNVQQLQIGGGLDVIDVESIE